jgi:YebC/PmpR family DNA-binding regulatory protein
MSGHNKWSKIKHKKGATDAKRGKIFTKLIRAITMAAREGGGEPEGNALLRNAIEKARASNLPKDKIDNAINRGIGDVDGVVYESLIYEGYGPGGVAIIVEVLTDNRNRTVAEIRQIFGKRNGNLGQDGCVAWMFELVGQLGIEAQLVEDEDIFMMTALEGGADDVEANDGLYLVTCSPESFSGLKQELEEAGFEGFTLAEIGRIPKNTVSVDGKEAQQVIGLVEALEDNDDVQNVYANFEIDDAILASI